MTDRDAFISTLAAGAEALGLSLSAEQSDRLWRHFEHVLETNQRFNLTRIVRPEEAAAKLYADSLAPLAWLRESGAQVRSCLDVGTGAGFPAVPLAVARPAWSVTAIDSTGKKADFLRQSAATLGIGNLAALHARGGEWKSPRKLDLVLFKAVGPLARCLSYTGRLLVRDGHAMMFKGPSLTREELDAGQETAERWGMQTWDTFDYEMPVGQERLEHTLVIYRKIR